MAVRFTLKKPQYGWRVIQGPTSPPGGTLGSDLVLSEEIKDWLEAHSAAYKTWTQAIKNLLDDHTYLYFFIMIEDDNVAMKFKLTWM